MSKDVHTNHCLSSWQMVGLTVHCDVEDQCSSSVYFQCAASLFPGCKRLNRRELLVSPEKSSLPFPGFSAPPTITVPGEEPLWTGTEERNSLGKRAFSGRQELERTCDSSSTLICEKAEDATRLGEESGCYPPTPTPEPWILSFWAFSSPRTNSPPWRAPLVQVIQHCRTQPFPYPKP